MTMQPKLIPIISILCLCSAPVFAQEGIPVHGNPKWHTVVGSGLTSGSTCIVRSVSTGAALGELVPGYKFLAFGANSSWITLGVSGQVGYIPASAAAELYPSVEVAAEYRSGGKTLEDVAEELRKKHEESKSKPLAPNFGKKKEGEMVPAGVAGGAGGAPGAAVSMGK